jgi:hypothetical protein
MNKARSYVKWFLWDRQTTQNLGGSKIENQ